MDEHTGKVFVIEIWQQAINGVTAVELINEGGEGGEGHSERAWLGISALLAAAANISKILWPKPGRERSELVAITGLDKTAALANRVIRNHFEHIDERIEAWGMRSARGNFIDTYIGALGGIGVDAHDIFRAYDPDTKLCPSKAPRYGYKTSSTKWSN